MNTDIGMETNNLLVEAFLVPSVPANEDGKYRLVVLFRDALRGRPIGVPERFLFHRPGEEYRRSDACTYRQQ
jgi:hypothetical protein